MKKIIVCVLSLCLVAAAASALRSTPAPTPGASIIPVAMAHPATGAGLNKQMMNDPPTKEEMRQLLCALIRLLDGCKTLSVTSPAYIDCCAVYTASDVNAEMTSLMSLYSTYGIPSGLTDGQITDALATIASLQTMLSGTLPDGIDPDVAAACLTTVNNMQKDLGG